MTPQEICNRYDRLVSERKQLDYTYELIERFVMPGKGRFFQEGMDLEESIDFRHRELFDSTAPMANTQLAASVHGSITSPVTVWHHLRFAQSQLNDMKDTSEWLEECNLRVSRSIQESNFSREVNEFYQEASGYGTAVIFHEEAEGPVNEFNGNVFKTPMQREIYFEEDWDGKPLATYRYRQYTPRQLVDRFGTVPEHVSEKAEQTDGVSEKLTVIHCIYKRKLGPDETVAPGRARPLTSERRAYQGKYILLDSRQQIGETSGYYEFPGYLLRWSRTAGSKFGHSPAMIALPNILSLNQLVEMIHGATAKAVDPPMKTKNRNIIGDLEITAAGLSVVRNIDDLVSLMPPGAYQIPYGWNDVEYLTRSIRHMFFVDQLELKESPAMTATEVRVRYELMQRMLGPTLGRIQSDFLDPLIERTFWMLHRKGALPEMPEEVATMQGDLDIEYVGPLARSQKMQSVDAAERWFGFIGGVAQVKPDVIDVPDTDKMIRDVGDILGVPAAWQREKSEVDEERKKRNQQMQQAQQVEQMGGAASAAKDMAVAAETAGPQLEAITGGAG
jgi:hypothetical protein